MTKLLLSFFFFFFFSRFIPFDQGKIKTTLPAGTLEKQSIWINHHLLNSLSQLIPVISVAWSADSTLVISRDIAGLSGVIIKRKRNIRTGLGL